MLRRRGVIITASSVVSFDLKRRGCKLLGRDILPRTGKAICCHGIQSPSVIRNHRHFCSPPASYSFSHNLSTNDSNRNMCRHVAVTTKTLTTTRGSFREFPNSAFRRHIYSCSSPSRTKSYSYSVVALRNMTSLSSSAAASSNEAPASISSSPRGLFRLLTDEQRALLEERRDLTHKARDITARVGNVEVRDCTSRFLDDIIGNTSSDSGTQHGRNYEGNESTFAIVVAGEFNAGKSTVINALLGQKLLEMGALPTTDCITVLAHASTSGPSSSSDHGSTTTHLPMAHTTHHNVGNRGGVTLHRVTNVPLLEDLTFVDTPGTNAVAVDHTAKTLKLLPTADLILFVTSADRPFPESERNLLQSIQAYRKSTVIIINKMDILESTGGNYGEKEKERVINFVADKASELIGARPIVIPVSARDALSAKLMHSGQRIEEMGLWTRSNFSVLESFLRESLTTETKIKSKLASPIGVAEGMMNECLTVLQERRKELATDVSTLNLLRSQMEGWSKDMENDMGLFRNDIRAVLKKEGERCQILMDEMGYLNQWTWTLLGNRKAFNVAWGNTKQGTTAACPDLESEILDTVREICDTIAIRARAQGQAVIEYLGKRPAIKSQSLVGSVTAASRFEDTRKNLAEKMTHSVKNAMSKVDPTRETNMLFKSLRQTMILSGALHVSALAAGVGTALEVLDLIPGVVSSATLASLGAYVVPYRNRQTAKEHKSIWSARSQKLDRALEVLCEKEMQRTKKRILDGVAPYTRYVDTEQERVKDLTSECEDLLAAAQSLRVRINRMSST